MSTDFKLFFQYCQKSDGSDPLTSDKVLKVNPDSSEEAKMEIVINTQNSAKGFQFRLCVPRVS